MRGGGWIWIGAAVLYALFWVWYTPLGGPLTPEEIDHYLAALEETWGPDASLVERRDRLRAFLEADTGGDFLMVNAIRLREQPLAVAGEAPAADARATLDRYTAFVLPYLLRRAGHPVLAGPAAALAIERWGIENADEWSLAGVVRYRSRRDLMEMAVDPEFAAAHEFKFSAIEKTFAFPIDPYVHVPGVRASVALAVIALACFAELLRTRRGRPPEARA